MSPAPMRIPSSAKTTRGRPATSAQNSGHSVVGLVDDVGVGGERARDDVGEREQDAADDARPAASDSSIIRRAAAKASSASPAPSARPTMTWPAIAIASSTSARKTKSWKAIWWAPSVAAPMRAQHRGGEHEARRAARRCGRTSCAPIDSERADARRGRAARDAGARSSSDANAAPIPSCASTVPQRRAVEAPVEAVDEEQLEHDVDDVGRDDDDERRAQVADAAQPALAGERDERHRHARATAMRR